MEEHFPDAPVRTLSHGGSGEITEKKSRFIATLCPVENEEDATAFIEKMKKQYWDARHNCSAFVIGDRAEITRCSDDGEPPHTAGRPMLDVLLGEGLRNVCVVVTRYFGGTLLGTGGLIRAYQAAVKEGLKACEISEKCFAHPVTVTTDYVGSGKLQYLAAQAGLTVLRTDYAENVTTVLLIPPETLAAFTDKLSEATGGKAVVNAEPPVPYVTRGVTVELL